MVRNCVYCPSPGHVTRQPKTVSVRCNWLSFSALYDMNRCGEFSVPMLMARNAIIRYTTCGTGNESDGYRSIFLSLSAHSASPLLHIQQNQLRIKCNHLTNSLAQCPQQCDVLKIVRQDRRRTHRTK